MEELMESYENMIYIVLVLSISVVVIFTIISIIIVRAKAKKNNFKCSNCSKRIDKDSNYCKYCGTKIDLHL